MNRATFEDGELELDPGKKAAFALLDANGAFIGRGEIEFHKEKNLEETFLVPYVSPFGSLPATVVFEDDGLSLDGLVSVSVSLHAKKESLACNQLQCRLTVAGQKFVSPAIVESSEDGSTADCIFIAWTGADGQEQQPILPEDDARLQTMGVEFFLQE